MTTNVTAVRSRTANTVSGGVISSGTGGQPIGGCVLVKSVSDLLLLPKNGNQLVVNGVGNSVPSGGISFPATGLTPNTTYFIYAHVSGNDLVLEASTTTHETDDTTGVEIKVGDATRTLVGMARPITGPAWADTVTQRYVRSWFNDSGRYGTSTLSGPATTTSPLFTATNLNIEALTWLGERVVVDARSVARSASAANAVYMIASVDGDPAGFASGSTPASGSGGANDQTLSAMHDTDALSEGYHAFGVMFKNTDSASTVTLVQNFNTYPALTLRTFR